MSVRAGSICFFCILLFFPLHGVAEQSGSQWLNQQLHKHKSHVELWQNSWLVVHGISALADAHGANRTNNKAGKRAHAVSAVSASLGFADLVFRPVCSSRASENSEQQMRALAENIRWRKSWKGHLDGWLTAVAGAVITAAGPGKDSDAVKFLVLAGLVTEFEIWSLPSGAVKDWDQYRSGRFEDAGFRRRDSGFLQVPLVQVIPHGFRLTWPF